jgi:hypothetical protein
MLVCKLCGCVVEDYGLGQRHLILSNIIPCNICKDRIVVCRECADDWAISRNALCVCCKRDSRIKEVLGD